MEKNQIMRLAGVSIVVVVAAVALLTLRAQQTRKSDVYVPPRNADGQPDLQGIWQVMNTAAWDIQAHAARLGVPAGSGVVEGDEIPYQQWALAQKQKNFENR